MDDSDKARYIELTELKRAAEAIVLECNAELAPLESDLLDHLGNVGMTKFSMNGHSVYVQEMLWAWPKGGDHLAAVQALRNLASEREEFKGLAELGQVRLNKNTISKVFREWEKGGFETPEELAEVIDLSREYKLIVRRSGR